MSGDTAALSDSDLTALIGLTAAVEALLLAGRLGVDEVDVIRRHVQIGDSPTEDVLSQLNARLRALAEAS